jgi:hypothetical protein
MPRRLLYFQVVLCAFLSVAGQEKKQLTEEAFHFDGLKPKMEFYSLSDALRDPTSVTSLRLQRQGLNSVPPDISKLTNLLELDLSGNEISDAGNSISALTKLEKLDMSGNRLTQIPTAICQLKNLKSLNLSGNRISSGSLACLSALERVYLNSNSLTAIPEGLAQMESLKTLYLNNNQITTLPEPFAKLPHLESFLICNNKIAEEPNAYKNTGIINYIFEPQTVNKLQLYKWLHHPTEEVIVYPELSNQPSFAGVPLNSTDLLSERHTISDAAATPYGSTRQNKWDRMGKYFAVMGGFGYATHKYVRKNVPRDRIYDRGYWWAATEYGRDNFSAGLQVSVSSISYTEGDYDYRLKQVGKMGAYLKYFLTPLSSKFRPYGKFGIGVNFNENNDDNDYKFLNLQARFGVDYFPFRFWGLNVETGFGAGSIISVGTIIRIPFRKRT